jgi:hypothetical protein
MGAMTALTHFIPITFLFLGTLSVRLIDIGMIVGHGIASFYKTAYIRWLRHSWMNRKGRSHPKASVPALRKKKPG